MTAQVQDYSLPAYRSGVWSAAALGLVLAVTALAWPSPGSISPSPQPPVGLEASSAGKAGEQAVQAAAMDAFAQLPVRFEQNVGQSDPEVRFLARGGASTLFLTPGESVLALAPDGDQGGGRLAMSLVGADAEAEMVASDAFPASTTNYLVGADAEEWHTEVPTYGRITYRQVYPDIDLVYHGDNGQLEFDFVVAPGADPGLARMAYTGASDITLDDDGDLLLDTGDTTMRQRKPFAYQDGPSGRQVVEADYELGADHSVGLRVGDHDRSRPLVIDPVIDASRLFRGRQASGNSVALDGKGNAYLTFDTTFEGYSTVDGFQQEFGEGAPSTGDTFVVKLDSNGAIAYSSYLGGAGADRSGGVAVDGDGTIYVTGSTFGIGDGENDFPVTDGLPTACPSGIGSGTATYVSKLDPTRAGEDQLRYSTCLGGAGDKSARGSAIAVDGEGNAYVTGTTNDPSFPVTPNAVEGELRRRGGEVAFATKLDTTASGQASLAYSTYLERGGADDSGFGIAVDPPRSPDAGSGNVYVTGAGKDCPGGGNAFVTKLSTVGAAPLLYSTCLVGARQGQAIAVDTDGNASVTGVTSGGFETTANAVQQTFGGFQDAFVAQLDPGGVPIYATYLGGTNNDFGQAIAVDGTGAIHVTGNTTEGAFPTKEAEDTRPCGFDQDGFLAKIDPGASGAASLLYARCFGGGGSDTPTALAVSPDGKSIWVGGFTLSDDFPLRADGTGGVGRVFIVRFADRPPR